MWMRALSTQTTYWNLAGQYLSSLQNSRLRHQKKSLKRMNESLQYTDSILKTHSSRCEQPVRQQAQTSETITRDCDWVWSAHRGHTEDSHPKVCGAYKTAGRAIRKQLLKHVSESQQYTDNILKTHSSRSEQPARQQSPTSEKNNRTCEWENSVHRRQPEYSPHKMRAACKTARTDIRNNH